MKTASTRVVWTIGLMAVGAVALAGEPQPAARKISPPQEPAGFVTGAIIGGFAAGPVGAVIGAGLGTWLGNRVHRAGDASKAEAQVAALKSDEAGLKAEQAQLQTEKSVLLTDKEGLTQANRGLTAQIDALSHKIESAQNTREDVSAMLDGLQGDVLFRTGSAEITQDIAHQVEVLAQAVAKSPALKVRVDGYADPRGTVEENLKLSEDRANAVRDLMLAAGVSEEALEVNAYGKSQSTAADADGFALERRVRLTLRAEDGAAVAQVSPDGSE